MQGDGSNTAKAPLGTLGASVSVQKQTTAGVGVSTTGHYRPTLLRRRGHWAQAVHALPRAQPRTQPSK